jgi:hypothetical protein
MRKTERWQEIMAKKQKGKVSKKAAKKVDMPENKKDMSDMPAFMRKLQKKGKG